MYIHANDLGLRPSSYRYILRRALHQYRINTSVTIYLLLLGLIYSISMPKIKRKGPVVHFMWKKMLKNAFRSVAPLISSKDKIY